MNKNATLPNFILQQWIWCLEEDNKNNQFLSTKISHTNNPENVPRLYKVSFPLGEKKIGGDHPVKLVFQQ